MRDREIASILEVKTNSPSVIASVTGENAAIRAVNSNKTAVCLLCPKNSPAMISGFTSIILLCRFYRFQKGCMLLLAPSRLLYLFMLQSQLRFLQNATNERSLGGLPAAIEFPFEIRVYLFMHVVVVVETSTHACDWAIHIAPSTGTILVLYCGRSC